VLVYLAGLQALAEQFDEALETLSEGETILRELGEAYALANNSGRILGRIHLLAGDPQLAERTFRGCCSTFQAAHDEAALSTVAAEVGQALFEQGSYPEADQWGRLAEGHAPGGDIAAQFSWRALRGKALAAAGRGTEGEALALEALRIVGGTDALTHHGDVLLDLSEVLRREDRQPEAGRRIEEALALFDRKGNAASAARGRSLLAEIAIA
jgi:tetratricopeptide (TPR) repeat protein